MRCVAILSSAISFALCGAAAAENLPLSDLTQRPWAAKAPESYFAPELEKIVNAPAQSNFDVCRDAIEKFKPGRATRLDRLHLLKGFCLLGAGSPKDALKELQESLRYRPSNSDTLYLLALAQNSAQLPSEQVLRTLDEALWFGKHQWIPSDEILVTKAELLAAVPQTELAVQTLTVALQRNSSNTAARALLSRLQLDQGNRGDAIRTAREGLTTNADSAELQLALANALVTGADRRLNRSDIEEAVRLTAKLSEKQSGNDQKKRTDLIYIRALIAAGQFEAAHKSLRQSRAAFGENDADFAALSRQLEIEKGAATASAGA